MNIKNIFWNFLSGVSYNPTYKTYLDFLDAQAIAKPTTLESSHINTFINGLDSLGLLARMKTGYLHGFGASQTGTVNIKDPSTFRKTAQGTEPTYTNKLGTKSAGAGSCWNTQYAANQYAGIETDLTTIIDINEGGTTSTTQRVYGVVISGNNAQRHQLNTASRFMYSGAGQNFTNIDSRGLYIFTYDGTNSVIYKDKIKQSVVSTPIAPTNASKALLLASNASTTLAGGITVDGSFARNIMGFFRFDRFTDADAEAFSDLYETLKQAISYTSNDWFVRAVGGSYGTETGEDFTNAFDGDAGINWSVVLPSNILYLCDTLNETVTVDVGRITVDGGFPSHPCTIDGDDTRDRCIMVSGMSYVTVKNITAIDALIDCIGFYGPGQSIVCEDCIVSGSGNQGFQNEGNVPYTLSVTYNRVTSSDNVDDGMSQHAGSIVEGNTGELYNNAQGIHAIGNAIGVYNDFNIHDNATNNVRAESTADLTFNDCTFNNGNLTNTSSVPIKLNNCDLGNCTLSGDFIIDGVPQTF